MTSYALDDLIDKVAVVVGASPGIGRAVGQRLLQAGARLVFADINLALARETGEQIRQALGTSVAESVAVDCTNRSSMRAGLKTVVRQHGRLDILVQLAAVFFPPDSEGRITDEQWRRTLDINLLGSMIAADEAQKMMGEGGGSIVLVSSANAVVAKKGSWAYDTSKAALSHLVREMAVEFAPRVRVNGVAPASVVEGSLQFPRERVETSLTKYGIAFDAGETTEALRAKLAAFYAGRTLLQRPVTPADVAEAVFLLASDRLPSTTGHILPVDSGLPESFLR